VGNDPSKRIVTKLQPVPFPQGDIEIEEIACGENHNLVIVKPKTGRREVYTWGMGDPSGALGHGTEAIEWRPRKLALPTTKDGQEVDGVWRGVSGGAQHSAFLFSPKD
jgi:alpha-tubulin suppressor-like RCC1 family protein